MVQYKYSTFNVSTLDQAMSNGNSQMITLTKQTFWMVGCKKAKKTLENCNINWMIQINCDHILRFYFISSYWYLE